MLYLRSKRSILVSDDSEFLHIRLVVALLVVYAREHHQFRDQANGLHSPLGFLPLLIFVLTFAITRITACLSTLNDAP